MAPIIRLGVCATFHDDLEELPDPEDHDLGDYRTDTERGWLDFLEKVCRDWDIDHKKYTVGLHAPGDCEAFLNHRQLNEWAADHDTSQTLCAHFADHDEGILSLGLKNYLKLRLCSEDTSQGSIGKGVQKIDETKKQANIRGVFQGEWCESRICKLFGRDPKDYVPYIHKHGDCKAERNVEHFTGKDMQWYEVYKVHFKERQPSAATTPALSSTDETEEQQPTTDNTDENNNEDEEPDLGDAPDDPKDIPRDPSIRPIDPFIHPSRTVHIAGTNGGTRKDNDPEPHAVIRIGTWSEGSEPATDGGGAMDVVLVAEVQVPDPEQERSDVKIREVDSWLIYGISIGDWENGNHIGIQRVVSENKWTPDDRFTSINKIAALKTELATLTINGYHEIPLDAFRKLQQGYPGQDQLVIAPPIIPTWTKNVCPAALRPVNGNQDIHAVIFFRNMMSKNSNDDTKPRGALMADKKDLGLPINLQVTIKGKTTQAQFDDYIYEGGPDDEDEDYHWQGLKHFFEDKNGVPYWCDHEIYVLRQTLGKSTVMHEWADGPNGDKTADYFLDREVSKLYGGRRLYFEVHIVPHPEAKEKDKQWEAENKKKNDKAEKKRQAKAAKTSSGVRPAKNNNAAKKGGEGAGKKKGGGRRK